ncbi:uncharacterized protein P884DRAFT_297225 [Thermothelomyces heterothallicus CBS 202.75]|uniref:uncharacterized protein n=1 Tax=Thermothelomyces heterothallicus CBS 202.75 TaxID=1149848 RepID=UPI003741FDD7
MGAGVEGQQHDALAEGRRIYLGNLLYSVKPDDVVDLLREAGFADSFEKLHISIDPVSGRNPGYCFAEFRTRDEADRALGSLPGRSLFNRPLKVGPCHPKSSSSTPSRRGANDRTGGDGYTPTFQRWGDWRGNDAAAEDGEQGPYAALRHLNSRLQRSAENAQLYIGGLGKMTNQPQHDAEMQEILAGYKYVAIGKRITPRPDTRAIPGNHHYCFVDFSSADEAERAMRELNGKPIKGGGTLRVSLAKSKGPAFEPEGTNYGHNWRSSAVPGAPLGRRQENARREGQEGQEGQEGHKRPARGEPTEKQRSIMASNNWRSRVAAN